MEECPNLNYISQLSKGNRFFEKTLMGIITKELPREIETYHYHLEEGDFAKTAGDVHKIYHKIRILGLEKGCEIAEAYRKNLLENNLNLRLDFESILTKMLLFVKKDN